MKTTAAVAFFSLITFAMLSGAVALAAQPSDLFLDFLGSEDGELTTDKNLLEEFRDDETYRKNMKALADEIHHGRRDALSLSYKILTEDPTRTPEDKVAIPSFFASLSEVARQERDLSSTVFTKENILLAYSMKPSERNTYLAIIATYGNLLTIARDKNSDSKTLELAAFYYFDYQKRSHNSLFDSEYGLYYGKGSKSPQEKAAQFISSLGLTPAPISQSAQLRSSRP